MAQARRNVQAKSAKDDAFLDGLDGGSEVLRATRQGDIEGLRRIFARHSIACSY